MFVEAPPAPGGSTAVATLRPCWSLAPSCRRRQKARPASAAAAAARDLRASPALTSSCRPSRRHCRKVSTASPMSVARHGSSPCTPGGGAGAAAVAAGLSACAATRQRGRSSTHLQREVERPAAVGSEGLRHPGSALPRAPGYSIKAANSGMHPAPCAAAAHAWRSSSMRRAPGAACAAQQRRSRGPHLRRRAAAAVELVQQAAHGADGVWVKLISLLRPHRHAHLARLGVHTKGRLHGGWGSAATSQLRVLFLPRWKAGQAGGRWQPAGVGAESGAGSAAAPAGQRSAAGPSTSPPPSLHPQHSRPCLPVLHHHPAAPTPSPPPPPSLPPAATPISALPHRSASASTHTHTHTNLEQVVHLLGHLHVQARVGAGKDHRLERPPHRPRLPPFLAPLQRLRGRATAGPRQRLGNGNAAAWGGRQRSRQVDGEAGEQQPSETAAHGTGRGGEPRGPALVENSSNARGALVCCWKKGSYCGCCCSARARPSPAAARAGWMGCRLGLAVPHACTAAAGPPAPPAPPPPPPPSAPPTAPRCRARPATAAAPHSVLHAAGTRAQHARGTHTGKAGCSQRRLHWQPRRRAEAGPAGAMLAPAGDSLASLGRYASTALRTSSSSSSCCCGRMRCAGRGGKGKTHGGGVWGRRRQRKAYAGASRLALIKRPGGCCDPSPAASPLRRCQPSAISDRHLGCGGETDAATRPLLPAAAPWPSSLRLPALCQLRPPLWCVPPVCARPPPQTPP